MPPPAHLLSLLLAALLLEAARADSYAIEPGTGDPVLWREGTLQPAWPSSSLAVGFLVEPPEALTEFEASPVAWYAALDLGAWNLTASSEGYDVPHSNLHSCSQYVGFCTPLIADTPGVATHTAALRGDLRADAARGPAWANATFAGELVLEAGVYTVIAHVRFFAVEAGVTVQYDAAMGIVRTARPVAQTCAPGQFKRRDGGCAFCPTGAFSTAADAPSCKVCGRGSFATDSPRDDDGAGVASGASACAPCPAGSYSDAANGSALCSLCQQALGQWSSGNATSCDRCTPGNFYAAFDSGFARACEPCPTGASCDGGHVRGLVVEPGYYRHDATTDRIRECPGGVHACVGGTAAAELCGRGHSGPLCDVCTYGHIMGAGGACQPCSSGATWLFILGPTIALLGVIVCTCLVYRFALALAEVLYAYLGFEFKIIYAQAQILSQIPIMFSKHADTAPPVWLEAIFEKLDVANTKRAVAFGMSCYDSGYRSFQFTLKMTIAGPLVTIALLSLGFAVAACVFKHDPARCFDRFSTLSILLLYTILPTASTTCFQAFLCDDDFGVDGETFMNSDYAQSCAGESYAAVKALAICGVVLYPVGVNCLIGFLLWRHRENIMRRDGEGASHLFLIFDGYKRESFYFELVDSVRRIALTGLLVFIPEKSRASGAMIIAMLFFGIFSEAQPFSKSDLNIVADVSNASIAFVFVCITILQGGMMPRSLLAHACIVSSCAVLLVTLFGNVKRVKRRRDALFSLTQHCGKTSLDRTNDARAAPRRGGTRVERGSSSSIPRRERSHAVYHNHKAHYVTSEQFRRTFADIWDAGPQAQAELRAQVMTWFDHELGSPNIFDENWEETVAVLEAIAPFNDASAQHEGRGGSMFSQIQAIASAHQAVRIEETHKILNASLAAATEAARTSITSLEHNFGEVKSPLPGDFAAGVLSLVPPDKLELFRTAFDEEIHLAGMLAVAKLALPYFTATLKLIYPGARVISDLHEMDEDERLALIVAPVKNADRAREKIRQAARKRGGAVRNGSSLVEILGDLLRATIVCRTMDDFSSAWNALASSFDVRAGHGRLKNNLFTDAQRPPDLLVNVIVEPPGRLHAIVAEVQIHLRDVLLLKEDVIHRLYELERANSMNALLVEVASKKAAAGSRTKRNSRYPAEQQRWGVENPLGHEKGAGGDVDLQAGSARGSAQVSPSLQVTQVVNRESLL